MICRKAQENNQVVNDRYNRNMAADFAFVAASSNTGLSFQIRTMTVFGDFIRSGFSQLAIVVKNVTSTGRKFRKHC